jgi:hypothetical protein
MIRNVLQLYFSRVFELGVALGFNCPGRMNYVLKKSQRMKRRGNDGGMYKMDKAMRTAAIGHHIGVKESTIYLIKNNGGKIRGRVTPAIIRMPNCLCK